MRVNIYDRDADVPLNLADPDLWAKEWFHKMFLAGLRRSGVSDGLYSLIENILASTQSLSSVDELIARVHSKIIRTDQSVAGILCEFEELSQRWAFNKNCYDRTDPSVAKVIQWPNNPRARYTDPQSYADIYETYFTRRRLGIIDRDTPIGSAGSCFALRIAQQLQAWGYRYVIEEDDLPNDFPIDNLHDTNYRMSPARVGTLFNIPSMRQMVERAFGVGETEKIYFNRDGKFTDPFRSIHPLYDSVEGYVKDYNQHTVALRRALLQCKVFIFTLGLTEAWQFAHSGEYTSLSPYNVDPTLLISKELTVQDNLRELERLYDVYKRHNPDVHIVISVSPVPLNKTFSQDKHVVEANCLSKATLRVAAEEFCRSHPSDTSYFPAFEVVMYGSKDPWELDKRHVSSSAVASVMRLFQHIYFNSDSELVPLAFSESMRRIAWQDYLKGILRPLKRGFTRRKAD